MHNIENTDPNPAAALITIAGCLVFAVLAFLCLYGYVRVYRKKQERIRSCKHADGFEHTGMHSLFAHDEYRCNTCKKSLSEINL